MCVSKRRRRRVEPTEDWRQLELLLKFPEQAEYERIRPIVVFGSSVVQRAVETSSSERTLYRKAALFDDEGVESLFRAQSARRKRLSPAVKRFIVDLKCEYPPFSLGELARICYFTFGREPSKHTVKRVIEEGPTPLLPARRDPPYQEIPQGRERRMAVVALHSSCWTVEHPRLPPNQRDDRLPHPEGVGHRRNLERKDGRRSPSEVLGWVTGIRYREEDLKRAFFSSRFVRILDSLGYVRFRHWKILGNEALASTEAALWLGEKNLTLEHEGQPISRYDVVFEAGTSRLASVTRPRLFDAPVLLLQPRLFGLNDALGEDGWLKALKLSGYSSRRFRTPRSFQQVLFTYTAAL